MGLTLELAGLATGFEVSARRRSGGDPTPMEAILGAIGDLCRRARIPRIDAPAAPPGFGLVLARPG